MKILITGGSGLLGEFLSKRLLENHELLSGYNSNNIKNNISNSIKLDIGNPDDLTNVFNNFKPEVVIHTAAYSRPEICDIVPREEVIKINVSTTEKIAELCHSNNCRLIFTSTDLVYDGTQGQMLKEDAKLNPLSLYAESKLEAEQKIINVFDNYIILRTSLLYGIGSSESVNNFHKMYINFTKGKPVKLFFDQFRTPLSLIDAAELISGMIDKNIKGVTLNFGGKERVSRVELGEMLCKIGGFDKSLIERISMNDVPGLHKVADVSLNTDKLKSYSLNQKSIKESIIEIIKSHNG
jgi:dTDP-4-dehydrorhamnose reductase